MIRARELVMAKVRGGPLSPAAHVSPSPSLPSGGGLLIHPRHKFSRTSLPTLTTTMPLSLHHTLPKQPSHSLLLSPLTSAPLLLILHSPP
ncbi:unnamed protein product [Sphenostylis stenocarpa]|uniref:Uncharacterized protein n=1 Tax=Sphenostylis stenocarpa TaxID=92480 RepID=A0AA86RML8_9FABA|nr:unnamed protein product [Sphenostylis stenocarpa]